MAPASASATSMRVLVVPTSATSAATAVTKVRYDEDETDGEFQVEELEDDEEVMDGVEASRRKRRTSTYTERCRAVTRGEYEVRMVQDSRTLCSASTSGTVLVRSGGAGRKKKSALKLERRGQELEARVTDVDNNAHISDEQQREQLAEQREEILEALRSSSAEQQSEREALERRLENALAASAAAIASKEEEEEVAAGDVVERLVDKLASLEATVLARVEPAQAVTATGMGGTTSPSTIGTVPTTDAHASLVPSTTIHHHATETTGVDTIAAGQGPPGVRVVERLVVKDCGTSPMKVSSSAPSVPPVSPLRRGGTRNASTNARRGEDSSVVDDEDAETGEDELGEGEIIRKACIVQKEKKKCVTQEKEEVVDAALTKPRRRTQLQQKRNPPAASSTPTKRCQVVETRRALSPSNGTRRIDVTPPPKSKRALSGALDGVASDENIRDDATTRRHTTERSREELYETVIQLQSRALVMQKIIDEQRKLIDASRQRGKKGMPVSTAHDVVDGTLKSQIAARDAVIEKLVTELESVRRENTRLRSPHSVGGDDEEESIDGVVSIRRRNFELRHEHEEMARKLQQTEALHAQAIREITSLQARIVEQDTERMQRSEAAEDGDDAMNQSLRRGNEVYSGGDNDVMGQFYNTNQKDRRIHELEKRLQIREKQMKALREEANKAVADAAGMRVALDEMRDSRDPFTSAGATGERDGDANARTGHNDDAETTPGVMTVRSGFVEESRATIRELREKLSTETGESEILVQKYRELDESYAELDKDYERLEANYAELREQHARLEEDHRVVVQHNLELEESKDRMVRENLDLDERCVTLTHEKKDVEAAKLALEVRVVRIETLESELAEAKAESDSLKAVNQRELAEARRGVELARRELDDARGIITLLNTQVQDLSATSASQVETIHAVHASLESARAESKGTNARLEKASSELERSRSEVQRLGARCEEADASTAALRARSEDLEQQLVLTQMQLSSTTLAVEDERTRQEEIKSDELRMKAELEQATSEVALLRTQLNAAQDERHEMEVSLANKSRVHSELEADLRARLGSAEGAVERAGDEVARLRGQLESSEAEASALSRRVDEARRTGEDLKLTLVKAETHADSLNVQLHESNEERLALQVKLAESESEVQRAKAEGVVAAKAAASAERRRRRRSERSAAGALLGVIQEDAKALLGVIDDESRAAQRPLPRRRLTLGDDYHEHHHDTTTATTATTTASTTSSYFSERYRGVPIGEDKARAVEGVDQQEQKDEHQMSIGTDSGNNDGDRVASPEMVAADSLHLRDLHDLESLLDNLLVQTRSVSHYLRTSSRLLSEDDGGSDASGTASADGLTTPRLRRLESEFHITLDQLQGQEEWIQNVKRHLSRASRSDDTKE